MTKIKPCQYLHIYLVTCPRTELFQNLDFFILEYLHKYKDSLHKRNV